MAQKVTEVRWSEQALVSLQRAYDFYSSKSLTAADNVVNDLMETAESIVFVNQYQVDEFRPDCRRMIKGNFKILYKVKGSVVNIIEIFDSRMKP